MLAEFGQAITLTRAASGGTYNPVTSKVEGGSPVVQLATGAVFEYPISIRIKGGDQRQADSMILAGDRQLLLSVNHPDGTPLNPPPKADDRVTLLSGVTYTITTVAPLAPAGIPVYFECNIRGAA